MNIAVPRFQNVHEHKQNGVTYTPVVLAEFLAKKSLSYFDKSLFLNKCIRILDPSIGDGILILELLKALDCSYFREIEVVGIDVDDTHFNVIQTLIFENYPNVKLTLDKIDFLDFYEKNKDTNSFDFIVANPPYIRTQIIGSKRSQELSKLFNLKGKVDIYYAFMIAISNLLSDVGVSATITSNRFLSIKSGQNLRDFLIKNLDIKAIYDLGDTKVFSAAAVLPALVFSKKKTSQNVTNPEFISIYELKKSKEYHEDVESIFEDLDKVTSRNIRVENVNFSIIRGILNTSDVLGKVWAVSTDDSNIWLKTVKENTWKTFKDVGSIRVGVKSTADKIFIRSDWNQFEKKPELLRYLLTSDCAQQFRAIQPKKIKEILYPHVSINGKKAAVNLDDYPNSKEYLESHKAALSSRDYLIKAGRNWYELWVSQNPSLWCKPKIVFPDISESPKFWMDLDGHLVNGECYWLTPDDEENNEILWLCLAVANSKFIEKFYDYKFNNKLYSGKRRFIKQYVDEFPIPDPSLEISKQLIDISKAAFHSHDTNEIKDLKDKLDKLVFDVFKLN